MPIAGLLSISSIRPLVASNSRRSLVVLLSDDLLLTIGSFSAHVTSLTLAVKFQDSFVTRVLPTIGHHYNRNQGLATSYRQVTNVGTATVMTGSLAASFNRGELIWDDVKYT